MWKSTEIYPLAHATVVELIENKIAGVRISQFATASEVAGFKELLLEKSCRTRSIEQVTRLGISQYQQGIRDSKKEYFRLAKEVRQDFEAIFAQSFSPVRRVIDHFKSAGFDADIMHEPGFGDYFAGSGKLRNGFSPIHVDYAPQDSQGWAVGASQAQLAWNFYLQVPTTGGELLLWDKEWQPEDDVYQVKDNYYYSEEVVKHLPVLKVKVVPGEVVIVNSRCYHAVAESENRLAYGSFISVFPGHKLRLWS